MQHWIVDTPWLNLHCALAEGPFYEKETNSLRFVDIKKKQLHTVPMNGDISSVETTQLDICPTVTADIKGVDPKERILVGVKYGLAVLDRKAETYEMLVAFNDPNNERLRSNDGAADPHGRFWLGCMTDFGHGEFQPEGSLFRLGKNSKEEVVKNLTIPNSIGWSPDNMTMYYTHSSSHQIFAYDYDVSSGAVSNHRLFYQHPTSGEPDGFRIDVDGNMWTAVYGESTVLKINPQGSVVGQISLPTRNITCVQFVGTELIITSASDDSQDQGSGSSSSSQYGGGLFRVDVGTTGLDLFQFRL